MARPLKKFDVSFNLYDEANRLSFKETLTVDAESQRHWDLAPAVYAAVNVSEHRYPNLHILYVYEHKHSDMPPYEQGAYTAQYGPGGFSDNPYVQSPFDEKLADEWQRGYTETLQRLNKN